MSSNRVQSTRLGPTQLIHPRATGQEVDRTSSGDYSVRQLPELGVPKRGTRMFISLRPVNAMPASTIDQHASRGNLWVSHLSSGSENTTDSK